MAFVFNQKPVATIKARSTTSTDTFTINGVTTVTTTPLYAATQINKILAIVGKSVGAEGMTRSIYQEAIEE